MSSAARDVLRDQNRLAIVALLATAAEKELSFAAVREKSGLSAGNLSSHLRTLEEAGSVRISKTFNGRRPLTTIALTPEGRHALEDYVREMEEFIRRYRER